MHTITPNDNAVITRNYLPSVIRCLLSEGYKLDDFEISMEQVNGYKNGKLDPKHIIYVFRKSTNVEINYLLEGKPDFSEALCIDLEIGTFN